MSGAAPFPVAPANGAAADWESTAVDGAGVLANRCPATRAISETSAIAATPQGSADEALRRSSARSAPAAVPQRWQNFAPGENGASQAAQVAPGRDAPQFEQNFPLACTPHAGQGAVASGCSCSALDGEVGELGERGEPGEAMRRKLHGRPVPRHADQIVGGSGRVSPARLRDVLDRLAGAMGVARLGEDVGLRDDADERPALIDDRNAPDLFGAHGVHDLVYVGSLAAGSEIVGAHHVAHAAGAVASVGDAANGNVAIGDDADELPLALAVDDRHDADVFAFH